MQLSSQLFWVTLFFFFFSFLYLTTSKRKVCTMQMRDRATRQRRTRWLTIISLSSTENNGGGSSKLDLSFFSSPSFICFLVQSDNWFLNRRLMCASLCNYWHRSAVVLLVVLVVVNAFLPSSSSSSSAPSMPFVSLVQPFLRLFCFVLLCKTDGFLNLCVQIQLAIEICSSRRANDCRGGLETN